MNLLWTEFENLKKNKKCPHLHFPVHLNKPLLKSIFSIPVVRWGSTMCVPTQFPALPDQQELLPVGSEVSDLFIWPLSVRLMHPITSGHSLFRSCSPAAKWMIKLERGTRRLFVESVERCICYYTHSTSCLSFFNWLVNHCQSSKSSVEITLMLTYTTSLWLDNILYFLCLPPRLVLIGCVCICGFGLSSQEPNENTRTRGERKTS